MTADQEDEEGVRFEKDAQGRLRCRSEFFKKHVPVVLRDEETITDVSEFRRRREPYEVAAKEEALGNRQDYMVLFGANDEDCEDAADYGDGGYHPVQIGDLYNKRFKVLSKLGWGVFSTVWLCWDQIGNKLCATKIVRSLEKYANAGLCEMELLGKISHQDASRSGHDRLLSILGAFAFRSVNGRHIGIVTEALGCNLLKLIVESPTGLPLIQVKSIAKQVLLGLDALHGIGIMHTDIKPENILVELSAQDIEHMKEQFEVGFEGVQNGINHACTDNRIKVKIADFSNAFELDNPCEGKIQTRQYRALEVIIGAKYGTPADIWSVACMTFELATGEYLFDPKKSKHPKYDMEDHHLALISQAMGRIPSRIYKGGIYWKEFFDKETERLKFVNLESRRLVERFPVTWKFGEVRPLSSFLEALLAYDTRERATAKGALSSTWLREV